jgi:hypothetical protein
MSAHTPDFVEVATESAIRAARLSGGNADAPDAGLLQTRSRATLHVRECVLPHGSRDRGSTRRLSVPVLHGDGLSS